MSTRRSSIRAGRSAVVAAVCGLAVAAVGGTTPSAHAAVVRPPHAPASSEVGGDYPVALAVSRSDDDRQAASALEGPIWRRVHRMTLLNKVRQMMVLSFSGTHVPVRYIEALHPGGLIYFSENLTSQTQTQSLSSAIQKEAQGHSYPLLLMTDQEGHPVTRIPGTENTPGGIEFHGNATWAHNTAVRTGRLMSRLGVNTDLAPVTDVNTAGADGVIGGRSFGSTPRVVSRLVSAQVCGYHTGGVATTSKHFPGHGSTNTDSHLHTAVIHETVKKWAATDLPPFEAAVRNSVDMILVGHLAFPAMDPSGQPATISRILDHNLLRNRLGYHGVVITDALNMGGVTSWGTNAQIAVKAVKAGNDLLLMPPQPVVAIQAIYHAVQNGDISPARIDMAVFRVLKLKQTLGLLAPPKHLAQCGS